MKSLTMISCLGLALLLGACDQGDQPAKPGPGAKPAAAATDKPKTPATAVADNQGAELDNEDIPVAADYEDKAEKEVTEANLEEKLAELEKELSQ